MTDFIVTFRGVPLIPPIECSDPNSWIAERIYEMGANDARAALRAAADQTRRTVATGTPSTDWGEGWKQGAMDVANGLLAIAAELEQPR